MDLHVLGSPIKRRCANLFRSANRIIQSRENRHLYKIGQQPASGFQPPDFISSDISFDTAFVFKVFAYITVFFFSFCNSGCIFFIFAWSRYCETANGIMAERITSVIIMIATPKLAPGI